MDTTKRLVIKSATWQAAGFVTMTAIGFVFTRSFAASGGIAIAGSVAGFVSYFLHEFLWSRSRWGQRLDPAPENTSA